MCDQKSLSDQAVSKKFPLIYVGVQLKSCLKGFNRLFIVADPHREIPCRTFFSETIVP